MCPKPPEHAIQAPPSLEALSHPTPGDGCHHRWEQPGVGGEGIFVHHQGRLGGVALPLSLVGCDHRNRVSHVVPQQPPERLPPVLPELHLALGQHLMPILGVPSLLKLEMTLVNTLVKKNTHYIHINYMHSL